MNFSILIPSFNDLRIIETIESIQSQNLKDFKVEIIVQDGGSSKEISDKIKSHLSNNDMFVQLKDDGIFDAINKGIQSCNNEIILTLGTDDRVHDKNVLMNVHNLFSTNNYDYVCATINYTDENWNPIRQWRATKPSIMNIFLGRQVAHFGFFCLKKIYEQMGSFSDKYPVSADFDFFCRLAKSNFNGGMYYKVAVDMKLGGNSSKNFQNIIKGNKQIFQAILDNFNIFFSIHFLFKPLWKINEYLKAKLAKLS